MGRLVVSGMLASLLGWFGGASPVSAQGPRLPPPLTVSQGRPDPIPYRSLADATTRKRTHWLEGALIGAAGGVLLAQVLNSWCDSSGCNNGRRPWVMLVGGFVIGGLIGGSVEKKP